MESKKIFLASSSELSDDRKEFEIFINRKNKDWIVSRKIFLEVVQWEDHLDAMSKTRLQDEYNKCKVKSIYLQIILKSSVNWKKPLLLVAEA
jgi:hypothetical protein